MKILVLSNPGAARARRGIPALREALPASDGVAHHVTEDPAALPALLCHDRWEPDDLLVLNGGDGTVQHALTLLLAGCPTPRLPRLACLPGGTTNMTAFDLNAHRRFAPCLETLRQAARPGAGPMPAPRSVVRVSAPGGAAGGRCGLFFGAGTIVQGIEYFHARIRRNGGGHEMGAGAALLRALWGIARQQPPFDAPLAVALRAPELLPGQGCGPRPVAVRLLLVTTLDRLFLGIRPYWGAGPGALKATLVDHAAHRLVRRMPRLLRGRPDATMTPAFGYHSARLDRLSLRFRGSFTLDGELFAADPQEVVDVSATERVKFLPL